MSTASRKRKTVFWNARPVKRRKINHQWFKNRKSGQPQRAVEQTYNDDDSTLDIQQLVDYAQKMDDETYDNYKNDKEKKEDNTENEKNNQDMNIVEDDNEEDDNDDNFEIVKMDKPNDDIIELGNNDQSALKIKFATPAKGKHTEYNLKSLQESIIESKAYNDQQQKNSKKLINDGDNNNDIENNDDDVNETTNISTRNDIICTSSEWHKLGEMNKHLLKHVTDFMKLSHPTIIQTKAIPHLLENKDLLIKSETGSGKTLAYLIPIISDLMSEIIQRKDGCKVMIIAPTRELCLQIYNVTNILCRHTPFIVIGHIMGGEDKKKEKQRIRKGLIIVIGTPGRILDHFENTKSFKFHLIKWLVLDEADILLNLGFEKFIRSIVKIIDKRTSVTNRSNILVSATLDKRIQKLAKFVLNKHVFISLNEGNNDKEDNNNTYIPATLKHDYLCLKREYQSVGLIGLLRMLYYQNLNKLNGFKVIIFMSTCSVINYYYSLFKQCNLFPNSSQNILPKKHDKNDKDISYFELRGDMTQKDRTNAFFKFCDVTNGILFCTDVASRGLDIPSVNFIIQYDPPSKLQDYIHRSGRTARMGRAGQTILFLTPKEMKYLDILKKNNFQFTQMPIGHIWNQLDIDYQKYQMENENKYKKMKRNDDGYNGKASMLIMNYENRLSNHLSSRNVIIDHLKKYVMNGELKSKAKEAMQTFVKAYTTYPRQLKSIFYIQNLDFYQCSRCFFIEREGRFLRKGGMRDEIKRYRFSAKRDNMRDVAQKLTKKRNLPSTVSEFAAM